MKNSKFLIIIIILIAFPVCFFGNNLKTANADDLSDSIKDSINKLDLEQVEDFFEKEKLDDFDFYSTFKNILDGKYNNATNVFDYIKNIIFAKTSKFLPVIIAVIITCLLYVILQNVKSRYAGDSVANIIKFVTILSIFIFIFPSFISICNNTKNIIKNIGKFSEIMSPIILTLMVASGGTVSATVFKPSVLFFSNIVINVFYSIVLPIIGIFTAFSIMSHFSKEIKLKKFTDFFSGILKWIFGIMIVFYGILISIQGISASSAEGISIKVAKYALSNSIPIIGGLVKDGLDVVTAGSIIIKNALGITGLVGIFYYVLSPVMEMIVFSALLKLAAAVTDIFSGDSIGEFLITISNSINYFIAAVVTVGLMAFLTVLLMVISANTVF